MSNVIEKGREEYLMREIVTGIITALGVLVILWLVGLIGKIPAIVSVPSKAVVAFESEDCPPEGWEEYKLAYGRFVRGIDRSGSEVDPDGERNPGSYQEDTFKKHTHGYDAAIPYDSGPGDGHERAKPTGGNGTTGLTGDAETRPKNVALLYCVKL
ncbi:MAG: hypothetical protein OXC18_19955 [Desulfurellaceae bacterium]|nr:hypothetical protein [Desulfurellaceae bacterium]